MHSEFDALLSTKNYFEFKNKIRMMKLEQTDNDSGSSFNLEPNVITNLVP